MDWQIDPRRRVYVRRLTENVSEVIGRFTTPSEKTFPSLTTILPLIDLFDRLGRADWEYAPSCLRLTESKARKISRDIWDWAVGEGLIVAIERKGAVIAYRTNDAWQVWMLQYATPRDPEPGIDWSKLDLVFEKYGRLGLRIASQLAFGDSHAIDNLKIPDSYREKIWVWRDAVPSGANIVRLVTAQVSKTKGCQKHKSRAQSRNGKVTPANGRRNWESIRSRPRSCDCAFSSDI